MPLRVNSLYTCFGIVLILICIVIAIGFRPDTVGSDTLGYVHYYQHLIQDSSSNFVHEYLFEIISRGLALFELPSGYFFTLFALFNFITLIFLTKSLSLYFNSVGSYRLFFLLISLLCISPFFLSAQLNVLRHGISIFILFLYYLFLLQRRHIIFALLLVLLAQGFHYTIVFYVFFSFLIYFKYSFILRSVLLIAACYCLGIIRDLIHYFLPTIYNKIMNYGVLYGYKSGIRYDFVIFTLGAGWVFHWLGKYLLHGVEQERFFNLLKIYWLLTFPFFFWGFGAYSDRYLLPSWIYLSVIAAVFIGLILKARNIPIYWYYLVFFLSSSYFILMAQGIIG